MQPHGLKVKLGGDPDERGFPIRVADSKVSITMSALRSALDQEFEEAFEAGEGIFGEEEAIESVLPLL